MKYIKIKNIALKGSMMVLAITLLSACKIVFKDGDVAVKPGNGSGTSPASCSAQTDGVNWGALLTENCTNLSDYNLFADSTDPTDNPNSGGIPYDLTTALFTDYASKYRFAFIPEGQKAVYNEHEAFDFPIGSVLVKTFAMPEYTSDRDGSELVIETRLLILREGGWVARPYYWETSTDATLAITGKSIENMTTNHKGEELTFTYGIPKATSCTSCHAVVPLLQGPDDTREAIFKPIGPKARFLNKDYDYGGLVMNQLSYWALQGKLESLPADLESVSHTPEFNDSTDLSQLNGEELNDNAKAYLDINCAHCHRSELTLPEPLYAGPAGGSGLQVEYNRSYDENPGKFGTCKVPVAGGHSDYSADVVPLNADDSYLLFRMSTNDERHRMPELGRSTVHGEGAALIRKWINNLPSASCSPAP